MRRQEEHTAKLSTVMQGVLMIILSPFRFACLSIWSEEKKGEKVVFYQPFLMMTAHIASFFLQKTPCFHFRLLFEGRRVMTSHESSHFLLPFRETVSHSSHIYLLRQEGLNNRRKESELL
jgi:hypothetical protein